MGIATLAAENGQSQHFYCAGRRQTATIHIYIKKAKKLKQKKKFLGTYNLLLAIPRYRIYFELPTFGVTCERAQDSSWDYSRLLFQRLDTLWLKGRAVRPVGLFNKKKSILCCIKKGSFRWLVQLFNWFRLDFYFKCVSSVQIYVDKKKNGGRHWRRKDVGMQYEKSTSDFIVAQTIYKTI